MSRAMPNPESIPIVRALIAGVPAITTTMKTDGTSVSFRGSTIVRIAERQNPDDTSAWKVEINLCGWGDTRTTRNNINSVLCRLNQPFRVGLHKGVVYLYQILPDVYPIQQDGEAGGNTAAMKVLTNLPENGWTLLPMETP